jgi:hypothetical protein
LAQLLLVLSLLSVSTFGSKEKGKILVIVKLIKTFDEIFNNTITKRTSGHRNHDALVPDSQIGLLLHDQVD